MITLNSGIVYRPRVFAIPEWVDERLAHFGMTLKDVLSFKKMSTILSQEEMVFLYATFDMKQMPIPTGTLEVLEPYCLADILLTHRQQEGAEDEKLVSLMDRASSSFTTICGNLSPVDILRRYVKSPATDNFVVAPSLWFVEDNVFCIRYSPRSADERTGAQFDFYSKACELLNKSYSFSAIANTPMFFEYLKLRQIDAIL